MAKIEVKDALFRKAKELHRQSRQGGIPKTMFDCAVEVKIEDDINRMSRIMNIPVVKKEKKADKNISNFDGWKL